MSSPSMQNILARIDALSIEAVYEQSMDDTRSTAARKTAKHLWLQLSRLADTFATQELCLRRLEKLVKEQLASVEQGYVVNAMFVAQYAEQLVESGVEVTTRVERVLELADLLQTMLNI